MTGGLDKWTALFYAALAGHVEVVGFLLAIGADTSRADAKGLTVVDHVEQNIDDLKEKLDEKSYRESSFEVENLLHPQSLMVGLLKNVFLNSLLVRQNITTARKSGNIILTC